VKAVDLEKLKEIRHFAQFIRAKLAGFPRIEEIN
jgi:hypothetical protein